MRRLLRSVLCVSAVLTVWACAKQGYPEGGPKDVRPPVVTRVVPDNATCRFAQERFVIEFDEYVNLKDAENNILVSPPMSPKPEYTVHGRSLSVRLRDTLRPQTTYLFQFRGAVADLNEGNVLPAVEYVFSTGDAVDSCSICGVVRDAFTQEPSKNVVSLMLYGGEWDDSTVFRSLPSYVTRADSAGLFCFNYIRPGAYHLVALEDGNRNSKPDEGEAVAWLDTVVEASVRATETDSSRVEAEREPGRVLLQLSAREEKKQRVMGSEMKQSGQATLSTALPMQAPEVSCLNDSVVWRLCPTGDTLWVWAQHLQTDSLLLVVADSSGLNDTLKLRYRAPRRRGLEPESEPNVHFTQQGSMAYFDTLRLRFSLPFTLRKAADDSVVRVLCLKDSSVTWAGVEPDSSGLRAAVLFVPQPETAYEVRLEAGRLLDLYGRGNDSAFTKVETTAPDKYGNLLLTLSGGDSAYRYIVELTDEKGNRLFHRLVSLPAVVSFPHLKPAKYRVRAICDRDGDGQWTPGHFLLRRQPEPVLLFPKTLDVRANWDIEEQWQLEP